MSQIGAFSRALATQDQANSPLAHADGLAHFLRYQSDATRGKAQATFFQVIHAGGDGWEAVTSEPLDGKLEGDEKEQRIQRISEMFLEAAMTIADCYDKPQMFAVLSKASQNASAASLAQYPFRLRPRAEARDGLSDTESADERGIVAQGMRHVEMMTRLLTANIAQSRDQDQRLLDKVLHRLEGLEDKFTANLVKMEELRNEQTRRDLEVYEKRVSIARTEQLIQDARKLLGGYLRAKYGIGEDADAPMAEFVRTMTPEQIRGFLASLTDAQRATISMPIVEMLSEEQKQGLARLQLQEQNA